MTENFVTQTWKCSKRKEVPSLLFLSIAKIYLQLVFRCLPDIFEPIQGDNYVFSNYDWTGLDIDPRCLGAVSFWELIRFGWGRKVEDRGIRFRLPWIAESFIDALEIPVSLKDHFRNEYRCIAPRGRGLLIRWIRDPDPSHRSLAIAVRRTYLCMTADDGHAGCYLICPFGFEKWRCVCMIAFTFKAKVEGHLDFYKGLGRGLLDLEKAEDEL